MSAQTRKRQPLQQKKSKRAVWLIEVQTLKATCSPLKQSGLYCSSYLRQQIHQVSTAITAATTIVISKKKPCEARHRKHKQKEKQLIFLEKRLIDLFEGSLSRPWPTDS
jgi:hypothetical protein